MSFEHPEYLYFLFLLPIFLFLFIYNLRRSYWRLNLIVQSVCWSSTLGSVSYVRQVVRYIFLLGVFLFLVIALARPRGRKALRSSEVTIKGAEVMILADVSNSMLVEDMGGVSRLSVMKKELNRLIDQLANQRVGLIAFAGSSVLVSPLTLDHSVLRLYLDSLSPQTVPVQGTDLSAAFRMSWQALRRGGVSIVEDDSVARVSQSLMRVIVVVSDGEDNVNQAVQTVRDLSRQGVVVFTIGLGTASGGPIPVYDRRGNKTTYKKDKQGNLVISKFSKNTLEKLSQVSGGGFYHLSVGGRLVDKISEDIRSLGKKSSGGVFRQSQAVYQEWYSIFCVLALICAGVYFLIGERKSNVVESN